MAGIRKHPPSRGENKPTVSGPPPSQIHVLKEGIAAQVERDGHSRTQFMGDTEEDTHTSRR